MIGLVKALCRYLGGFVRIDQESSDIGDRVDHVASKIGDRLGSGDVFDNLVKDGPGSRHLENRIRLILLNQDQYTGLDKTLLTLRTNSDEFHQFYWNQQELWCTHEDDLISRLHEKYSEQGNDFPLLSAIRLVAQRPKDDVVFYNNLKDDVLSFQRFFMGNLDEILEIHELLTQSPLDSFDVEEHIETLKRLSRGHLESVKKSTRPVPLDEVYGLLLLSVLSVGREFGDGFNSALPRIALELLCKADAGEYFTAKTGDGIRAWNQHISGTLPSTSSIKPLVDPARPVISDVLSFVREYRS